MIPRDEIDEILEIFRAEARELLQGIGDALLILENSTNSDERSKANKLSFRSAHNIKGAAASIGIGRIEKLVHLLEDVFVELRDRDMPLSGRMLDEIFKAIDHIDRLVASASREMKDIEEDDEAIVNLLKELASQVTSTTREGSKPTEKAEAESSSETALAEVRDLSFVRISGERLDKLSSQLGELVEMKIRMEEMSREMVAIRAEFERRTESQDDLLRVSFKTLSTNIELSTLSMGKLMGEIQEELIELRMVPCSTIFPLLRRAVRDVCRKRNVDIDFKLEGGGYQLDRNIVERMKDPLIHLLRNAVDHGIESADERLKGGKSAKGQVILRISHMGHGIRFSVIDDGRGIDFAKIRQRVTQLGLLKGKEENLDDNLLLDFIFSSGVSTSHEADSVSGRGVGLDVVKKNIVEIQGVVTVDTRPGKGTAFNVNVPLTLATDTGLFIVTGGEHYVVPRSAILQVVTFGYQDVTITNNSATLRYEGQPIVVKRLEGMLRQKNFLPRKDDEQHLAIVLQSGDSIAAFVVDEIDQEAEIVIRDVGSFLQRLKNISGLTIMPSGDMCFVINPIDIVRQATRAQQSGDFESFAPGTGLDSIDPREKIIMVVDDSATSRILNQKLLSDAGFQVLTAGNGLQALEVLRRKKCDLVLSDVNMPHLDGLGLTKRIKSSSQLAGIPVVLLTSLSKQSEREEGLDAGADAYMVKSQLNQKELIEIIEQLV
jgi:two-component system chemotaxis sensor kinase CheA